MADQLAIPEREPWERQPGETLRAFAAFKLFRDLGRSRSIAEAARLLGIFYSVAQKWSSKREWKTRCAAWDAHRDQEDQNALAVERVEARKRRAEIARAEYSTGAAGLILARKVMDGEPIEKGEAPSIPHAVQLIDSGFANERKELGEPDQTIRTESRTLNMSVELGAMDMDEVARILRESRGLDIALPGAAQSGEPDDTAGPEPDTSGDGSNGAKT